LSVTKVTKLSLLRKQAICVKICYLLNEDPVLVEIMNF